MFIHLADCSRDRGQYGVLLDEGHPSHLFSYAYAKQVSILDNFERVWDGMSHIYLAGNSRSKVLREATYPLIKNHLATYADPAEVAGKEPFLDPRARVIIDSGAFTAFTTGKVIKPEDYADFALAFRAKWEARLKALHFMNLDVIGDQEASWRNQTRLEELGVNPIPIITFGADRKHLRRALEGYDYFALGGLVPYIRQREKLTKWLDGCFAEIMDYKRRTGVFRKVHLLGVTTKWCLERYPMYSSDSSSWIAPVRFGGGQTAGFAGKLPRYKESDGALAATVHTLRAEVRKFMDMEAYTTKLWAGRGVVWED